MVSESCMRATPAAPATQPRPDSGMRFTSWRSPTRVASRASRVGTASPVTVVEIQRRQQRLLAQAEGDVDVDEGIICLGEAAQPAVAWQRQCGVARLDPAAEGEPSELRAGKVGQRANTLVLAVPVLRECHCHPRHGWTRSRSGRRRLHTEVR